MFFLFGIFGGWTYWLLKTCTGSVCAYSVGMQGNAVCCSAVMTVKMQCNMMKTSKTGVLLSVPYLLDRPLQREGMSTGFSWKLTWVFLHALLICLCASTSLIKGVRFVEQVEISQDQ